MNEQKSARKRPFAGLKDRLGRAAARLGGWVKKHRRICVLILVVLVASSLEFPGKRAFVAERSTPENRPKIRAILEKHGVRKLTELQESQYAAVMDEVAAL